MKKPPKKRPEVVFDPSWIPEYTGDPVDWLDRVTEASLFHPRDVIRIPMILEAAGVSRRAFTPEVIKAAVRLTYLTVKAEAKKHNRLVTLGKASGIIDVSEFAWVSHAAAFDDIRKPTQEEAPSCPSGSSTIPTPPKKPESPNGKKKSPPAPTRRAKGSGGKESKKSRKRVR